MTGKWLICQVLKKNIAITIRETAIRQMLIVESWRWGRFKLVMAKTVSYLIWLWSWELTALISTNDEFGKNIHFTSELTIKAF